MCAGVNAELRATEDTVEQSIEDCHVGCLHCVLHVCVVVPSLGGVGVQVAGEATLVFVEDRMGWSRSIEQEIDVNRWHSVCHTVEWARHDASTSQAVGNLETWCQLVRLVIGVGAVTGHGVLITVENVGTGEIICSGGPVPIRHCSLEAALFLEVLFEKVDESSMPDEEEAVEMNGTGLVDVNDSPIEVSVDGSRVYFGVKLGWFGAETVDGISKGFPVCRRHVVEVIPYSGILVGTLRLP